MWKCTGTGAFMVVQPSAKSCVRLHAGPRKLAASIQRSRGMTETEKLLNHAQEIARRAFDDPSEKTVMDLFDELRAERDRRAWEGSDAAGATVH